MTNIEIILQRQPDMASVAEFIRSLGGIWVRDPAQPASERGVFEKDEAAVIIRYTRVRDHQYDYEPNEIEFLKQQLGREPDIELAFSIGRDAASLALAEEIAHKAVERWGGYIDYSETRTKPLGSV